MRKLSSLLVAFLLIGIGCGGGGGDGGGITGGEAGTNPTREALTGKYMMTGITFSYSNGLVATEKDLAPWSGSMDIGPTTTSGVWTILGDTSLVGGPYTATWTSDTGGTISEPGYSFYFTLSGGKLTFHFEKLAVDTGVTADAWIYWQKYSDSYTSKSLEIESIGTNDVNISESINQLMQSLVK